MAAVSIDNAKCVLIIGATSGIGLLVCFTSTARVAKYFGVQYNHFFNEEVDLDQIIREMNTNYLAVVSLISMFIPHFLKLSDEGRPSFIISITSYPAPKTTPSQR
ncbi:hypothetical protein DFH08DRAFT_954381 [Mycena albidolilacea]|uniref:Uncharacterized protein n=1 Tax=Mycena albidolilacea TaxID=1033008 RepID=A0AAD7AFC1_9AGAR|nr:hypothetical protein DFH08DRAFT_954381 [Mycena albidolilacea]